jgi:superfamily II DNA/RNA helicase
MEGGLISYLREHHRETGNGRMMAFTRWSTADRDDGSQSVVRFCEQYRDAVVSSGGWMKSIVGSTSRSERESILKEFDSQHDGVLSILVSCKTISEGVDTRNANSAFFVDTDSNNVSIIQRIGRATRPYRGVDGKLLEEQRPGSVIVGMYISPEKYERKSKAEVDAVLKQEMSEDGDFAPIFRVLAALRQTDEEMYERYIRYPHFERIARKVEEKGYDLMPGFDEELSEVLGREVDTEDKTLDEIAEEEGIRIVEHREEAEFECGEGKEEVHVYVDGEDRYLMAGKKDVYCDTIEKKRKRKKALMLDIDPSFRLLFGLDKDTNLDEDVIAKIDIEIEDDGKTNEERALERARELVTWVRANLKTPSPHSKDPVEKRLAKWLCHMKQTKRGTSTSNVLYPSVEQILIEALGEEWWEKEDLEANAIETATQLVEWIKVNGKNPRSRSKDLVEKKIGQWLSNIKSTKKGTANSNVLYPSVEQILIEALGEEWWEKEDLEANAIETANQVVEWVREHDGKTPRNHCKDPVEKKIGQWLSIMKSAKRHKGNRSNVLYPSVEQILIEALGENWWENVDREANAIETANQVVEWVRANKKTPRNHSKDPVEKKLGQWLSNIKSTKRGKGDNVLYPSVEKILIKALGENWWENVDREANAIETANQVVEWVSANLKTPSHGSKNLVEKKFGIWLNRMRQAKKGNGNKLYPSVEKILIEELGENWYITKINTKSDSTSVISTTPSSVQESHSSTCLANPCTCRLAPPSTTPKPMVYTIPPPPPQPQEEKAASPATTSHPKPLPVLSQLHKEYKTLHSRNLHARFHSNTNEWREYHRVSEHNEQSFGEEVPYKRVIQYIQSEYKKRKPRVIADLGCGMARVARAFSERDDLCFINIDHVAYDQTVQEGDIAQTGLEEGEVDLAILCLAMWGSNCEEYLVEVSRILDTQGRLVVIEPSKRWDHGTRLRELLLKHNFVINKEESVLADGSVKKFCLFVASKR